MHIAVDATPLGEQLRAGVATYTLNLLKSLAKLDLKNKYTIYGVRLAPEELAIKSDNFKIKKMPDIFRFWSVWYSLWYSWAFWYYTGFPVQLFVDKPDIFLSTHPALPLYCPCPKIAVVHDLSFLRDKSFFKSRSQVILRKQLLHVVRRAKVIIAVSESTKKDLINFVKASPEKVAVIYEGYDTDAYKPQFDTDEVKALGQRYGIGGHYVLYVGTLEPRKNISRLIEAFASLKKQGGMQHKLVIAGKKGWFYNDIFQTVTRRGVDNEVVFTGYVPDRDLPLLISGADLFVYPSLYEGFGLPPLEAMACGIPVITSDSSSLPEVVGNAGILVDPHSVDEIAKAMYQVLSNAELREQMQHRGLDRARMFSWEKTAEETLKVFEAICPPSSSSWR